MAPSWSGGVGRRQGRRSTAGGDRRAGGQTAAVLRRRRPKPLPDDWEDRVARMDPGWWDRSVEVRTRIRDLAEVLLGQARWEAARGFEITDDVRLLVVTQAVRLLVGMEVERFPDVRTVIVHDTTIVGRGERPGPAAGVYAVAVPDGQEGCDQLLAWLEAAAARLRDGCSP